MKFPQFLDGTPLLFVCLSAVLTAQSASAAESPWTSANRIAISADGNPDADADDVGATPFTLAVLAKAGLQDNLVHYDFNNFLEYKRIDSSDNRMWIGAMGGQARWGYDASRFFDATIDPDGAIDHLIEEINKSSAEDPLYLVAAGPLELVYRALEAADVQARQHVIIVSHHNYNEYFKARLWQRNFVDVKQLVPNIGYLRIKDQNGWGGNGLKGADDSDFHWLRDHADPNLNWVYDRIVAGKPDVSDTGMITWLIGINGNDEAVTIPEMQAWFGPKVVPMNGGQSMTPAAPAGVTPEVVPPETESIFVEVDGRIVIEAESIPLTEEWVLDTTAPGYSGEGSIRWMPATLGEISHQHRGVLVYKLRITNSGTYRMALRASQQGAPKHDQWSSCFTLVGLNPVSPYGNTRRTYHSISQEEFDRGLGFSWHTMHQNYGSVVRTDGKTSEPLYELDAGDHYFWICGRAGGYRLDKIHFFKEGVSGFKDDSSPVTPTLELTSTYFTTDDVTLLPSEEGRTEYYMTGPKNSWLGINAGKVDARDKFARAELSTSPATGVYDVTITTVTEIDGESTYRLLVNDQVVATYENPRVGKARDLKEHTHTWKHIPIELGDVIAVESNTDSNDLIPEGDSYAWARGRWKDLRFDVSVDAPVEASH